MKIGIRNVLLFVIIVAASDVFAVDPQIRVAVRERASGRLLEYRRTDSRGNFTLGSLPAGAYTLEFRSLKAPQLTGQEFLLIIAGAKENGMLSGIPGSDLARGVAINIAVGADSRVSGQMGTAAKGPRKGLLVWVPPDIGSHAAGHWADAGAGATVPMHGTTSISLQALKKMQEHQDQGQ
ncbi:MAG: hypothetical protein ABLT11_08765 [Candidatus Acidiferrum sp.]